MRIVIASNRPLPIRFDERHNIWFHKGVHAPPEIRLPFFIEVEIRERIEGVFEYIDEMLRQYKKYELQLFCPHTAMMERICNIYPEAIQKDQTVWICK